MTFTLRDSDGGPSSGFGGGAASAGSVTDAAFDRSSGPAAMVDGEARGGAGGSGVAEAEGGEISGHGGVDASSPGDTVGGGAGALEGAGGSPGQGGVDTGGDVTGSGSGGSGSGIGGAQAGRGGTGQGGSGHQGGAPASGGSGLGQGGSAQGDSGHQGGASASGGAWPGQGGSAHQGGSAQGGSAQGGSAHQGGSAQGGSAQGGATASGGAGGGGMGGSTGIGGATGTGGTDLCPKSTTGSNVAVIGESFIAINHGLTQDLEALARAAHSLASGENYDDESIDDAWMSSGTKSIPTQYATAQLKNDIRYVLMDGGRNDCMSGGTGDNIVQAATQLFQQMATDGVQKVVYFFYPDPTGSSYANLKVCLDQLRPRIKALCEGLTSPKCYFVDLRDSWSGHAEYTSDGIHATAAGDTASSRQIWAAMVSNCVAQ